MHTSQILVPQQKLLVYRTGDVGQKSYPSAVPHADLSYSVASRLNIFTVRAKLHELSNQREADARLRWFNGDSHQLRLPLLLRTPPIIQSRDCDAALGAIRAPRHSAFRKSLNDFANLFLAPHPAIFNGVFYIFKTGSLDAYGPHRHKLPDGYRITSTPILGGLHHEYGLEKEAA